MAEQHEQYLHQCIELAAESARTGAGPFAAIVVRHGEVLARASNQVTGCNDATAHAEVQALRQAGRVTGDAHLEGCTLYASCEPCPMCLAASMWAHVSHIVYAASQAEAARAGFDDSLIAMRLYGQAKPVALEDGFLKRYPLPEAVTPFEVWLANEERREY